jgi:PD-(D/E)XK nuclease superfamily
MQSTQTQIFHLSQGQLNNLESCPRKFQHTFLDKLNPPLEQKQEESINLGNRFHLLMQQREMGLPIDAFLAADSLLQSWSDGLANVAPEIFQPIQHSNIFRDSEHFRALQIKDYLLSVIYDLIIADDEKAEILDWKTYPKPLNKRKIEQNWQTRLYMYVLAQTSHYPPENISMTYWFVQSPGQPQSLKFNYSSLLHQQIEKKLDLLLNQLSHYLEIYHQGENLPQVKEGSKLCEWCQYARRCDRVQGYSDVNLSSNTMTMGQTLDNSLLNIANIQEVIL